MRPRWSRGALLAEQESASAELQSVLTDFGGLHVTAFFLEETKKPALKRVQCLPSNLNDIVGLDEGLWMPKIARELSALEVGRLRVPGLHLVGGVPGLGLRVSGTGARSWMLRVTVGEKRRDMGLGPFPAVTLAMVREKARLAREQIEAGVDPVLQRQQARSLLIASQRATITFESAARAFINAKSSEWKNGKHTAQWSATLETYAYPVIGAMHVADVQQTHVLNVLEPIWTTKTETASRLRGRIENILDWARVKGFRAGENPARWRGHLDKLLPVPGRIAKVQHHPAVPIAQIASFYADVKGRDGMAARALEFALLTAARSGEVRGATWDEIDMDAALWVVPDVRMKGKKEHRVPLSKAALELLRGLPRLQDCNLVFPAPRGGQLSDMSLTAVMRRMRLEYVPHGLRSTFRDWAADHSNHPRELAEHALAHVLTNKVEAAYHRSDMLDRRRLLMQDWANFIASPVGVGKVIPLERKAA